MDDPTKLLTPVAEFKVIGQAMQRPDIPLKTNGAAKFGIDVFLPGMVFAAVRHCPTVGGTLASTLVTPAGAIKVVPLKAFDSRGAVVKDAVNAFAVVADNTWRAMKGLEGQGLVPCLVLIDPVLLHPATHLGAKGIAGRAKVVFRQRLRCIEQLPCQCLARRTRAAKPLRFSKRRTR